VRERNLAILDEWRPIPIPFCTLDPLGTPGLGIRRRVRQAAGHPSASGAGLDSGGLFSGESNARAWTGQAEYRQAFVAFGGCSLSRSLALAYEPAVGGQLICWRCPRLGQARRRTTKPLDIFRIRTRRLLTDRPLRLRCHRGQTSNVQPESAGPACAAVRYGLADSNRVPLAFARQVASRTS